METWNVSLNGGKFDAVVDVDYYSRVIRSFEIYLGNIYLTDLLNESTLAFCKKQLEDELCYSLAFNDISVKGE